MTIKAENVIRLIIKQTMQHAHNCIKNTRELNRTVSMGESKRHVSKYAQLLTENKLGLMEDLELLTKINNNYSVFYSAKLSELYRDFENAGMHLSMYQKIIKMLHHGISKK